MAADSRPPCCWLTTPSSIRPRYSTAAASGLLDLIEDVVDAVAYLPDRDGTIDQLVAGQVMHAHGLGMPVFRIIGRDVVLETVPLRLAA